VYLAQRSSCIEFQSIVNHRTSTATAAAAAAAAAVACYYTRPGRHRRRAASPHVEVSADQRSQSLQHRTRSSADVPLFTLTVYNTNYGRPV